MVDKDLVVGIRLIAERFKLANVAGRRRGEKGLVVTASGGLGKYRATVEVEEAAIPRLRVRVTLRTASNAVLMESMPREVCMMHRNFEPLDEGYVYTKQTGPTAGLAFVAAGDTTLFYFQNLTALASYGRLAEADLAGSVGVNWPQIGFSLPEAKVALPARRQVVISDAFIRLDQGRGLTESGRTLCFMENLENVYRVLAAPAAPWFDWEVMARKGVADLHGGNDCLRRIRGKNYLNAYVGGTNKPPESMVQGALYVPLLAYEKWLGKPVKLTRTLDHYSLSFFDPELSTMRRWLPGARFTKVEPSEEEDHDTMDSWYLLHTLMSLGRQADFGRDSDRETFLKSIDYAMRVANHFKHDWPVFYHRKTLKVIKPETKPGEGGEQDVPGLYVHVMMQAWRMTREKAYLDEAEAAAVKLRGLGFGVLYQTNNAMFAAIALGWLWAETGNTLYKDLSFVCMGSILSHLWMWEAEHPRRSWHTFMALPPLHDAPYIAPYEEAEIFILIQAYSEALGSELPECIDALLAEYGKNLLHRGRFYYPAELPVEALCAEPKEGFLRRDLAIPVEDLYPSRDPACQVGQEVYGAGLALVLTTRSCHRWAGVPFDVWTNVTPMDCEFTLHDGAKSGRLSFQAAGTRHYTYSIRCIPNSHRAGKLSFAVYSEDRDASQQRKCRPQKNPEGHYLCTIRGASKVTIDWRLG